VDPNDVAEFDGSHHRSQGANHHLWNKYYIEKTKLAYGVCKFSQNRVSPDLVYIGVGHWAKLPVPGFHIDPIAGEMWPHGIGSGHAVHPNAENENNNQK
jgi:hypothetical protein